MEQMTQIINFLVEDAKIIVAALWVIGYLLKNTPKVKSWLIPWVLMAASTVLTSLSLGGFTVENLVQAVIVAGVAIGGHQLVKQTKKGIEDITEDSESVVEKFFREEEAREEAEKNE